ncbi:rhodanese-like domain-containing protein, partial [Ferroplasma acidiphilum]|uniref:rhodanese-like domain-containing protein n=1 Tax=Ferroplasma acidiphilum TaxID=74969 RepID=UPI0023F16386
MVINIVPDDLIEMVSSKDCVIIDVREKFEYDSGHIKDSILMPMYDIFKDVNLVKKYKDKKIVLVCSS